MMLRLKGGTHSAIDATEGILEIKQFIAGRMASNPCIESNCMHMVYPLSYNFVIEN